VLTRIDESLEAFLRAAAPLSAVDIDVSFETPSDDWAAKLTRPTVNLHLWDLRRSNSRAVTGVEDFQREGVGMRRLALPRLEMHYFVSVWTTEHGDERALLAALLLPLLANREIPPAYLHESLAEVPHPTLQIASAADSETFSIDHRMKLGLHLLVTAVVDTGAGTPFAPAVGEISIGATDTDSGATSVPVRRIAGEVANPSAVGATVRSPRGVATVNEAGRFLIAARPGDEIVVETDPPLTVVAPPVGGVVVDG